MDHLSFEIFMVGSVKLILQEWRFGRFKSSKVIDFCVNQKRVCDFLLVPDLNSNFGTPILHRFRDIAGFLCWWVVTCRGPGYGNCMKSMVNINILQPWWRGYRRGRLDECRSSYQIQYKDYRASLALFFAK